MDGKLKEQQWPGQVTPAPPSPKGSQHSLQGVPSAGAGVRDGVELSREFNVADKNITVNLSSHSLESCHWGRREV